MIDQIKVSTVNFALISLLFATACGNGGTEKSEISDKETNIAQPVKSFETLVARPEPLDESILFTGRLVPVEKYNLFAQVQGTLVKGGSTFKPGVNYRKGDILVEIDKGEFTNSLNAQRSRFISSLLRAMSDIKSDYPNEFTTWNTYLTKLKETEILPELPKVKAKKLRYYLTSRDIYNQFYVIKSQERRLDHFTIRAPFSGAVTMANVATNSLVSPGVKLGEMIRTDLYEMVATVSVAEVHEINIGQNVSLNTEDNSRTYLGEVVRIGSQLDRQTQSVPVYLSVTGDHLKSGLYLKGSFKLSELADVVKLPKKAIHRSGQVYMITNNRVTVKEVSTVSTKGDEVWVRGLETGDQVIIEEINQPILGLSAKPK